MRAGARDLSFGLVVLAAAVVTGLVVWTLSGDTGESAEGSRDERSSATSVSIDRSLDPVDLVAAFGRSQTASHAVDGELTRTRGGESETIAVRRAVDGDATLEQIGRTTTLVRDGTRRVCEQPDDEILCGTAEAAPSRAAVVAAFGDLVLDRDPAYVVTERLAGAPAELDGLDEVTCWSIESTVRPTIGPYGERSTLCFDDDVGPLVGRITERIDSREQFVATDVRAQVEPEDLEPVVR